MLLLTKNMNLSIVRLFTEIDEEGGGDGFDVWLCAPH